MRDARAPLWFRFLMLTVGLVFLALVSLPYLIMWAVAQ